MEMTISKAQTEVWEMKEIAYNKIKDLPENKRISFIIKDTEATIQQILKFKKLNLL